MPTLRRLWARPLATAVLVALLPFLLLAARALADGAASPSGDVALIEVRVGDVGPRTPLLGSYGRFGFNHPGPLLFYVLAAPYRLFGSRYAGMEIGALLLGALSVAAILRVAFRRGGRLGLVWAALVVGVFLHGVGPVWLLDPWEPHVLPLVAAASFALAYDAVAGRPSALPLVAAAGSLLAQSWATLLPLAVAMGGWSAAGLIVRAGRSTKDRRDVARAFAVTLILVVVLWAPPVLQQLSRQRGNFTAMLDALDAPVPPLGVVDGWRAVSTELGHRASWLGFPQAIDGLSPTLDLDAAPAVPIAAVALLAGLAAAWRRRATSDAWVLGATAVVAIGAATFALSRLLGPIYVWIPQWLRVVGMTTWLAAGWCAFAGLSDGVRARARVVLEPAIAILAAVVLAAVVAQAVTFDRSPDPLGAATRRLVAGAGDELQTIDGPVLVSSTADANLALGGTDVALEVLVLSVQRLGHETMVAPDLEFQYGPERARARPASAEVRLVRADDPAAPGFTSVGEVDPLAVRQRATRTEILSAAGLDASGSDADYLRAVLVHPELRADAARLRAVPDLPRLRLLLRRIDRSNH